MGYFDSHVQLFTLLKKKYLRNTTCDQKWRQHFRDGMRRQICLPREEALVIIIIIVNIVIIKILSFMVMRNATYKFMYTQLANVLSISHCKVQYPSLIVSYLVASFIKCNIFCIRQNQHAYLGLVCAKDGQASFSFGTSTETLRKPEHIQLKIRSLQLRL